MNTTTNPARSRYLKAQAEVDGHIHAALRSAPQTKTFKRWHARRLTELQAERDAAKAEVVIAPTTRLERLHAAAAGHPDNESTQAARRLLARLGEKS